MKIMKMSCVNRAYPLGPGSLFARGHAYLMSEIMGLVPDQIKRAVHQKQNKNNNKRTCNASIGGRQLPHEKGRVSDYIIRCSNRVSDHDRPSTCENSTIGSIAELRNASRFVSTRRRSLTSFSTTAATRTSSTCWSRRASRPRCSCSIYTPLYRFLLKPPIQPEDVHTLIYHRRLFVVLRSYILRSYVPLRDLTRSCRRQFISYLDLPWSKAARCSSPFCKANVPRRPVVEIKFRTPHSIGATSSP